MTVPAGKVPISECVREGFLFLSRDWRGILPVALVGAVVLAPVQVWMEAGQARADAGTILLAWALSSLLQLPILAAFLRRAISRGEAPLALQFGKDEANLAGAAAAVSFFYFIVGVLGGFFFIVALGVLLATSGIDVAALESLPPEQLVERLGAELAGGPALIALALGVGLLMLFLWLAARLSLIYPATVGAGRVMVFSTWSWTKGNGLRIAIVMLLLLVIAALIAGFIMAVPLTILGAMFGAAATSPGSLASYLVAYVNHAVSLALLVAPFSAMTAYLYRGLRPVA